MRLDAEGARRAIREQVAEPLGLSVERAGSGILAIAVASMANAVRAVTTERGLDPRDFTLIAHGGGGPPHAVAVARELAIGRLEVGDAHVLEGGGGGGFGDPFERPVEAVAQDVRLGYVSAERAQRDYGVAFSEQLSVDVAATERLRQRAPAKRGESHTAARLDDPPDVATPRQSANVPG
jgi:N-methylhydantoinase A/oxoprolinase/acetone carboxylase beta subunit